MQIHELDNFAGDLDSGYFAVDDGNDTGKVSRADIVAAVSAAIELANTRIDNLISGVTVNSEVIDARVGSNGVTYASLGAALRGQVSGLENQIGDILSKYFTQEGTQNLTLQPNYVTGEFVKDDGTVSSSTNYNHTVAINVYPGDVITMQNAYLMRFIAAYTNGAINTSAGTQSVQTYTVPDGVNTVIISLLSSYGTPDVYVKRKVYVLKDTAFGLGTIAADRTKFIYHNPRTNFLDYSAMLDTSYVYKDGTIHSDANLVATDYIELEDSVPYYWSNIYNSYYAFYDADYEFVSSYDTLGTLTSPVTIPAGAKFVRFSILRTDYLATAAWLSKENSEPLPYSIMLDPDIEVETSGDSDPCNYRGDEFAVFNKCLCIGDSITSGTFNYYANGSIYNTIEDAKYSYPTYLKKMTGVDVTNLGRGGRTSDQWYALYSGEDLSGYDVAIIELGINDVIQYTTWGNTSETAFANIISKLQSDNQNIKIFVLNIIPATYYSGANYQAFSADMLTWLETNYANDPNVIPLDIHQYGHTLDSQYYNLGHLSAIGYRRLAQDLKSYISYIIANNLGVFSEVQFIGTNYQFAH